MLRVSEFARMALEGKTYRPPAGLILIWNLTNRCNLYCKHCYSSANQDKSQELTFEEVDRVARQLAKEGVKFAILSGGEPLLREDIHEISRLLRNLGIKTYLSTNGLLITKESVKTIKRHYDYVGISIDGTPEVHDRFRGKRHAFETSLNALMLCLKEGIKTGLRFTLTEQTAHSLPFIFELAQELGVTKVYISHLVYAGRGKRLSQVEREEYRKTVEFIIRTALDFIEKGIPVDVVTGNNEADAVVLYRIFKERYPERADNLLEILKAWGGNQAGVRLVNIDHRGNVKPDPFFFHSVGNVREKSFGEIWNSNGLLSFLREKPRRVKGKCENCNHLDICNGNSRARAYFASGDYAGEDPLCYL